MTAQKGKTFKEIISGERPTIVDFHAEWCGPCKHQGPILDAFKNQVGDKVGIIKVDVDKNQNAAAAYQVRGVPTLIIFKNGEIKWRKSGVVQASELEGVLNGI